MENATKSKENIEFTSEELLNIYQNDENIIETDEMKGSFDLEELELKLQSEIEINIDDVDLLEEEKNNIRNPDALGEVIKDTIFNQINAQLGVSSGEQFIEKNQGMTADLRKSAHIQTTENFEKGKIATHNKYIDYQKRYDDWQNNFQKDANGNVITHKNRIGKQEATLKKHARDPYDKDRPSGSKENATDMDHTISAGEIIRDSEANAHLSKDEQIAFANSDKNLNEMDSNLNRSKGDKSMDDWLDNPNANGQKPDEIFDNLDDKKKQELRKKDKEARKEYKKLKEKGKKRSEETGKASRKAEAFLVGTQALVAALRSLLVSLIREIIGNFVTWLKSKKKKLKTFLEAMKNAIHNFVSKLKTYITNAVEATVMAIVTMIFGPVGRIINSVFQALKQGINSIRDAIRYIKNPENKKKPLSIMALEIGKIVIAGLSVIGGFALGEAIEKGLMTLAPAVFGFEIPLFGSIASIIGVFLGALIAGLVGAIIINFIDKIIAKKQKNGIIGDIVEKQNDILGKEAQLLAIKEMKVVKKSNDTISNISDRREILNETTKEIMQNSKNISDETENNLKTTNQNHRIIQMLEVENNNEGDFENLMNTMKKL